MLTNSDIQKLSAVLATKEDLKDFYNKAEIDKKFSLLQTSIDRYMKKVQTIFEEAVIQKYRLSRVDDWVQKASNKIGIDYNP